MSVIALLDRHLPTELTDKIYKMIHQSCMREVCNIIKYKMVFICSIDEVTKEPKKMSFLICEKQNYYYVLNDEIFIAQ